jgi:hypothetical protein
MQTTSALYQRLIRDSNHWFETSLVVNNTIVRNEDKLFKVATYSALFEKNPEIGKAISAEIDASFIAPDSDIPTMATLKPYVRVHAGNEYSEWLPQGVFYIDTRSTTHNSNGLDVMTVHGYDAMLKAEQAYSSTSLNWPARDINIVSEIASKMGVSVDTRTWSNMGKLYTFPLPTNYTLREMLCYIAAAYCGCFIITEAGKLRLVTMTELPVETNLLITNAGDVITFGGDAILV